MLEEAKRLVAEAGPAGYVVLALASFLEYALPFLPGDALSIFGIVLAVAAGHPAWAVYFVTVAGAAAGGTAMWGAGRWLEARHDRWPRMLRGARAERALAKVRRGYERYGAFYLVVNRFVPAFRAFFFVAAGLSNVRLGAVLLWGTVSAAAWYGLLLFVGWSVARSYDALAAWLEQYSIAALAVVVGALLIYAAVGWARRRSERPS